MWNQMDNLRHCYSKCNYFFLLFAKKKSYTGYNHNYWKFMFVLILWFNNSDRYFPLAWLSRRTLIIGQRIWTEHEIGMQYHSCRLVLFSECFKYLYWWRVLFRDLRYIPNCRWSAFILQLQFQLLYFTFQHLLLYFWLPFYWLLDKIVIILDEEFGTIIVYQSGTVSSTTK